MFTKKILINLWEIQQLIKKWLDFKKIWQMPFSFLFKDKEKIKKCTYGVWKTRFHCLGNQLWTKVQK